MQIKKEDVKNSIKLNAKEIFFSTPYKEASMRDVAEKSGMTVGNIYRYYANKEVLFDDIVGHTYDKLLKLIKITDFVQKFIKKKPIYNEKVLYKNSRFKKHLLSTILNMICENSVEIYILINNSETSKYENIKELLTRQIQETIIKMVGIEPKSAEIYSFMVISTVSYILKESVNNEEELKASMEMFFTKLFESFV